ncbi:sigma-70 family RNA polymerase sigma factor [candidate division WOR-3 bacterium]|uniref:Sigma-70 family RNA polymerase sigma factor n=1 Tax=candidate division WOR-3 bacterium TaxID=2052148 RepID=A0A9D5K7H2_UNCW3|nr:sigma-70 family RNA polymerase sigma factor [candidate division WOR-3 bacterium]MBD3363682.1 sigma-70 family RNA polymerase sigma factor [candidate division WOR-3 bacterium]
MEDRLQVNKEDIALVERALGEDYSAQREIVKRYQGPIFAYVYRWMRNRADAEDLTQDVFIKMFRALGTYSRKSSFRAWLYRIARNRIIDFLRRKKPYAVDIDNVVLEDENPTPIEVHAKTSEREMLDKVIESLPPLYREVLLLRHRDELTYEEIVESTGIALGTIKARLHRARAMLKKQLTEAQLL